VIDFLFCEINPDQRAGCFKYYLSGDERDRLHAILTPEQRNYYAARMLIALEVAYQAFCNKRKLSWGDLLDTVEEAVRGAA
jgi:hypothetical protein